MKKNANVNDKKSKPRRKKILIENSIDTSGIMEDIQTPSKEDFEKASKKVEKIKTFIKNPSDEPEYVDIEPDLTVRNLTNGDKSILDDLGITEKQKELENLVNERFLDINFVNDLRYKLNDYLNLEGKAFISKAEESLNTPDEIVNDDKPIFIKLILGNDKERILFKELLLNTERYPIYITIGDYDFFFERFDEDQHPIFSFSKESFTFFFSDNIENFKSYLMKNEVEFGIKYDRKISFDNLNIEILVDENKELDTTIESKVESMDEEPIKEEIKADIMFKRSYKVRLFDKEESFYIVTDNPSDIFNHFTVDKVLSVKLIGKGVCI